MRRTSKESDRFHRFDAFPAKTLRWREVRKAVLLFYASLQSQPGQPHPVSSEPTTPHPAVHSLSRSLVAFLTPFCLLLTALLSSCEPEPIDIALPAHESRLVIASALGVVRDTIFGQPIGDSALVVTVSRSLGALTGAGEGGVDSARLQGQLVSNARVVLVGDGRTDTLQMVEQGTYLLPQPALRTGTPYTLMVKDPATGLSCQATGYYLPRMRFDYVQPSVKRTDHDTTVTLEYQLTDKPGRSFYLVQYTPVSATLGQTTPDVQNAKSLLNSMEQGQRLRLLTDNDFNAAGRFKVAEVLPVNPQDSLVLGIAQISEDYFRFLEAYRKSGKLFNQFTGEPINYPTNVQGGYGFFTMHVFSGQLVDLSRY